jgi:hypothetical protein
MSRSTLYLAVVCAVMSLSCAHAPPRGAGAGPTTAPVRAAVVKPKVKGFARQRVFETIDRGVAAMPAAGKRVHVSWRLLNTDPGDIAFHVYRRSVPGASADEGVPVCLTAQPIRNTTDFTDANPPAGQAQYFVRPVVGGREGTFASSAIVTPSADPKPYVSIKLAGDYTFQKLAIADLDGDGQYDYVIKQPNSNVDPYEQYWKKSPGTYKIEAYRHDGKLLWVYDLGWSIEQGIWYSPYVVYDFDGDGKAEVAVKTGAGDPRDADGRVQSGAEYLSILDGLTGKEKTRIDWPSREGLDDYNYYCRNQLSIAYLDGKTPCLLVQRGTYKTIKLHAYEFHNNKLHELWHWVSTEEKNPGWNGHGAHCLRAADIDGDGREEVVLGSATIDDNGNGLWTTRLGHPDHVYIGDLDPARPGLEIFYGVETKQKANGMCMVEAATGKILWGYDQPTRHVHGQGLCADIDAAHPGVECYAADTDANKDLAVALLFDAQGNIIGRENLGGFAPKAAYWDADCQRELVSGGNVRKYKGAEIGPKIEGTIVAVADLLGDWREEVVTTVPGELRIYSTTIPATDRRTCLMQDPIYRMDVSSASQGYYQIPTPSVLPR